MRVRILPAEDLPHILGEEWIDPDRHPFVENNLAYVPVRDDFPADREIPERQRYCGRGYQMIGDIAIIHGNRPTDEEISGILAWKNPRGILWVSAYNGIKRIPSTELLYGSCGEVVHREAGISYQLDPSQVMFAQGNRDEKLRIARLIRDKDGNERVADMFAGIGYFTLPAAKAGATVHAMEINPVSYSYLTRNIQDNRVAENTHAECGDCRTLLCGEYDRIIMGHFDAPAMLPNALRHAHTGKIGRAHV